MAEQILRKRMRGLYLSRCCEDITQLSRELTLLPFSGKTVFG